MGKAHYINATLHFFLFALALLEKNGQSPLLSPQWLDLKPTHFLRDLLTWHLGQCAQGGHSPELIYAVRPCFAVCALLWDAAAVSLLIRTEGTVWLTLISLACFKWTIHGCHLSLSLYRGKSHHIVFLHLPIYWIQTLQRRYYWHQIAAMMTKAIFSFTPIEPFTPSSKVYSLNILKRKVYYHLHARVNRKLFNLLFHISNSGFCETKLWSVAANLLSYWSNKIILHLNVWIHCSWSVIVSPNPKFELWSNR